MTSPLPLFKATYFLKQESAGSIVFPAPSPEIARHIALNLSFSDVQNWEVSADEMTLEAIDPMEEGRDA